MFQNQNLPENQALSHSQRLEMLKTGTTTIGIVIKDGVILATESQATAGFFVATKQAQKLFKVNEHCGMTIAGGVADCQYMVSQAQAISRLMAVQHDGKEPSTSYISNVIRNIAFNGRSYFYAFMIVGGYDVKEKRGKLMPIDFLGYMAENEDFVSMGSGSSFALGVLEAGYKSNKMTQKQGIALAEKALAAAKARDAGSGYENQIVVITKDGFNVVSGPLSN
ncbi:MAG: proteasome subunit beta [Promethearchaeota archaeon]